MTPSDLRQFIDHMKPTKAALVAGGTTLRIDQKTLEEIRAAWEAEAGNINRIRELEQELNKLEAEYDELKEQARKPSSAAPTEYVPYGMEEVTTTTVVRRLRKSTGV